MRAFEVEPPMTFLIGFCHDGADLCVLAAVAANPDLSADSRSFARAQHYPPIVTRYFFEQKNFKLSTRVRIDPAKPRWDYTGIIQDENVASPKILHQITESPVRDLRRITVQNEKSRLVPTWSRCLSDKVAREVIVKVGCEHIVNIFENAIPLNPKSGDL